MNDTLRRDEDLSEDSRPAYQGRIYLRGRIWWIAYYTHGQQRRESSHSYDKKTAEKLLQDRLMELTNLPSMYQREAIIYVVQRGQDGPIKIGMTTRLSVRLKQLQTGSSEPLIVIRKLYLSDFEAAFHANLREFRLQGEWFSKDALIKLDSIFSIKNHRHTSRRREKSIDEDLDAA